MSVLQTGIFFVCMLVSTSVQLLCRCNIYVESVPSFVDIKEGCGQTDLNFICRMLRDVHVWTFLFFPYLGCMWII